MEYFKACILNWKDKKQCNIVAFVFQILLIGVIGFILYAGDLQIIKIPMESLKSEYISMREDGVWYVDNSMIKESIDTLIYTDPLFLDKGTYRVHVLYSTEYDTTDVLVWSDKYQPFLQVDNSVALHASSQIQEYNLEVMRDIDDLKIAIQYDPWGYTTIQEITIFETRVAANRIMVCLVLFFLLFDVLYCTRKHMKIVMSLIGITVLSVIPSMIPGLTFGFDLTFHLYRIEGLVETLQNAVFPARIYASSLESYGYPVSIFYGDILLYIPAILRLLGFSVTFAYEFYVVLISLGTTIISYVCLRKIFQNEKIALIGTLAYVTSAYRMIDVYSRSVVGEYTAMMFLPIIGLALYRIYTSDEEAMKGYHKYAVTLALGMSGVIQCHILTTQMTVIIILIVSILLCKKTLSWKVLLTYIEAVLLTIVLSAFFVIPFLDYYINMDIKVKATEDIMYIQERGAYIGQYFSFFQQAYGTTKELLKDRLMLTPGLLLMCAPVLWGMKLNKKSKDKLGLFFVVLSVGILWMSSNIFPWDYLAASSKIGNFLAQIQFPFRYLAFATLSLTLVLCRALQKLWTEGLDVFNKISYGIVVVGVIMTCFVSSQISVTDYGVWWEGEKLYQPYDEREISTNWTSMEEYIRTDTDKSLFDGEVHTQDVLVLKDVQKKGLQLSFYCETGESVGVADVPFLNYKGYKACTEDGMELQVEDGNNNVVRVIIPAEYSGTIHVKFEELWYWNVANWVSVISVIMLLLGTIILQCKKRRVTEKNVMDALG